MKKVLVANRGEIACRVQRAASGLGMTTVAIHSPLDAGAMHVELADEHYPLSDSDPRRCYLDAAEIVGIALRSGCDAVHPGYGFLSENAAFAEMVENAGLIWIGPEPDTIRIMGDKQSGRRLARESGIPVLAGTDGLATHDPAALMAAAARISYPLLVKASGGGGGIGMQLVSGPDALLQTIDSARSVARRAFGAEEVFLEHFVRRARHIEVQVFGSGDGRAVHFFERECSIQRRFQKIIEESPSPALDGQVRTEMLEAAVTLARRIRYRGAGTIEFIYDEEKGQFFFLEMNTRIQVEHPVTEMVTARDLVELQLRQAAGEDCLPEQESVASRGHAIECRLYAENPAKRFFPSPGRLVRLRFPPPRPGLRVETGLRENDDVTQYYDPMIAKIIGWGETRDAAIAIVEAALHLTEIEGLRTNRAFLLAILRHPDFVAGRTHTSFVESRQAELLGEAVA